MIEQPLEPSSIAFAVAIMAMGSALQASAGVGLALFVVPLLALVDRSFIPGPYAACRPPDHPVDGLSGADSHRRLSPAELAYLGAVAVLAAFGLFGSPELLRAAILLPGVAIGVAVAPLLARYIDGERLRLIILCIAALSGLTLLVR